MCLSYRNHSLCTGEPVSGCVFIIRCYFMQIYSYIYIIVSKNEKTEWNVFSTYSKNERRNIKTYLKNQFNVHDTLNVVEPIWTANLTVRIESVKVKLRRERMAHWCNLIMFKVANKNLRGCCKIITLKIISHDDKFLIIN